MCYKSFHYKTLREKYIADLECPQCFNKVRWRSVLWSCSYCNYIPADDYLK